jgi:hypothetical protein
MRIVRRVAAMIDGRAAAGNACVNVKPPLSRINPSSGQTPVRLLGRTVVSRRR